VSEKHQVPPFAVEVRREGSVATVAVTGELDVATSPRLEAAFAHLEPGYERLVVDLSDCAFFASSGISILLAESDRAASAGVELAVVKAPPDVQRMFDLVGLEDRLTFVDHPPA
jgi:anti-sigma B factor antagonist